MGNEIVSGTDRKTLRKYHKIVNSNEVRKDISRLCDSVASQLEEDDRRNSSRAHETEIGQLREQAMYNRALANATPPSTFVRVAKIGGIVVLGIVVCGVFYWLGKAMAGSRSKVTLESAPATDNVIPADFRTGT
jgi:hypothetical protein